MRQVSSFFIVKGNAPDLNLTAFRSYCPAFINQFEATTLTQLLSHFCDIFLDNTTTTYIACHPIVKLVDMRLPCMDHC